jgi:hypothetical protein
MMQDFKHLRDPYHMQHRDTAARHYDGVITDPQVRRYSRALDVMMILLVLAVAITILTVITGKREESPPPTEYCEMTQLYVETRGEFGWPDFNSNMHLCIGDGT